MGIGSIAQFDEEFINFAADEGLAAIEVLGIKSHSVLCLASEEQIVSRLHLMQERGVKVCGIIIDENVLSSDERVTKEALDSFYSLLNLCERLGGDLLTMATGRDDSLSLDDNLKKMVDVYGPMIQAASSKGVRLAFENCPGHATFATSIENLERIFSVLDSEWVGLEFDPSHFVWQGMDYIGAANIFRDRIFRVHAKDTQILDSQLRRVGIHGDGWWTYRLPGYGKIDWQSLFRILSENAWDGLVIIENEDPYFMGERYMEGVRIARRFLSQYVW